MSVLTDPAVDRRSRHHEPNIYVVEASYVGHDLTRGTTVFARATRPERVEAEEDDQAVKELIHGTVDMPQLDSLGQQRSAPTGTRVA